MFLPFQAVWIEQVEEAHQVDPGRIDPNARPATFWLHQADQSAFSYLAKIRGVASISLTEAWVQLANLTRWRE